MWCQGLNNAQLEVGMSVMMLLITTFTDLVQMWLMVTFKEQDC